MIIMKKTALISVFMLALLVGIASCHQPRIVMGVSNSASNPIAIGNPEVSKAYYGELNGQPDYYEIDSQTPFSLYVNILVPNTTGDRDRRFSVDVTDSPGNPVAFINGTNSSWAEFYEPFGQDSYLMGPEARANVSAGNYKIKVFSQDNKGKYSLAVGELEAFPADEILNAMITVPILKITFFRDPFYSIFFNIAGAGILAVIIVIIMLFFAIRSLIRRFWSK